jgi:hypothetical protein
VFGQRVRVRFFSSGLFLRFEQFERFERLLPIQPIEPIKPIKPIEPIQPIELAFIASRPTGPLLQPQAKR